MKKQMSLISYIFILFYSYKKLSYSYLKSNLEPSMHPSLLPFQPRAPIIFTIVALNNCYSLKKGNNILIDSLTNTYFWKLKQVNIKFSFCKCLKFYF